MFAPAVPTPRIAYQVSFWPDPALEMGPPSLISSQTHLIIILILQDYPSGRHCSKNPENQALFLRRKLPTKPKRGHFSDAVQPKGLAAGLNRSRVYV